MLISRFEQALKEGGTPAQFVHRLTASGLNTIDMIGALRTMTGASIGEIKSLGQWWTPEQGVTDASKFNRHFFELFELRHTKS